MHAPLAPDFADIAGARAYMAGKAPHISGVSAGGDVLIIRLRRPLPDFVSRIAQPAMCAVPANTPVDPKGVRVIPSAGPYHVTPYTPGQGVVLARNPNYRGSRPHRLARIELRPNVSSERAVPDVIAGAADHTTLLGSTPTVRALAARLARRYGPGSPGRQRYFAGPGTALNYLAFHTHRPLFRDARLRRAVSYAIDRRALAALGNPWSPLPARPSDQYLPSGIPGTRDAHVYPLTPDVARGRALAQGEHRTAVLYTCELSPCDQLAQIVKNNLAAIRIPVDVKPSPLSVLYAHLIRPGEAFDLTIGGWTPDYPDPPAMLTPLLREGANLPTVNDPAYQRRLRQTDRLTG